ncbi:hypothetical protein G6011_06612 [Alternaria panax]|uniref:Uncharacterized protein n=1 Tax=Alternaria panax TaxID=48097 RepID=A0AAD4FFS0_9PLEO|nr:hypothetical protein G6011_06612 [Alternaria panax]
MEAANVVDVTKGPSVVERGRLTRALIMTIQVIISLILFAIALPFFILWRAPISLLYFTKKEKPEPKNADQEREKEKEKEDGQEKADEEPKDDEEEKKEEEEPPKDPQERAVEHFNKAWNKFRDCPINKPLVTYWSRIAVIILLVIQTSLSLALLEKSLVYHIPWFVAHLSNTQYKTTKKNEWGNDFLLHIAGLAITCAPFIGLIGVGVGIMYYMIKITKYGKFQKGARKKKGGRGYDNPKEKSRDGGGDGHGVKEVIMGAVDHVVHPHLHLHPHAGHDLGQRQQEASSYGYPGYSEDILFEQPGDGSYGYDDVIQPPPAVIQSPEKMAWYDKNPYTLAGIASIWTGNEEKMKKEYDGRDVRRRNFEEDFEMADRTGRK